MKRASLFGGHPLNPVSVFRIAFALQQILIVPLQDLIGDMEDFVNVSFGIVGQSEKMFQWNRLSGCRCGSAADLC